jgi:hypothetical protein
VVRFSGLENIVSVLEVLGSADFAESIALMRASSAISGRRLRVRFGHVVVGSEAGSGAYRICPPCGDLQSVISTLRSPTPSL